MVVVVSAMGGVTEELLRAATAASQRDTSTWEEIGQRLRERHLRVCSELLGGAERERSEATVAAAMATFHEICSGFSLVREMTPRSLDALSSLGELMSAELVAATLRGRSVPADPIDATRLIVSDDNFGDASPLLEESRGRITLELVPMLAAGRVPVVTGFRAASPEGSCTTLGRGGSDYSATIIGTLLPADEIWIWTDVDGIMTADPRLVPTAHVIPVVSYQEAIELSFFGAKVLHPKSIELPMRSSVPVWIKNTFRPDGAGTKISVASEGKPGVRAIAHTTDAQLFTIGGSDGVPFTRLAASVFANLELDQIPTLIVTQSSAENVICFAVNGRDGSRVRRRLERDRGVGTGGRLLSSVEIKPAVGIVVAVGEAMRGTLGIAGRLFGALGRHDINVMAISQGSTELSISSAVMASDVVAAVNAIHEEFSL
jgi:aspartate kinase